MDINVASVKNYEGKAVPIDCEITSPGDPEDDFRIVSPVRLKGELRNFGGTLELDLKGEAELVLVCDRCAEEYERTVEFGIEERFKEQGASDEDTENPDVIYFSGDAIGLDEHVYSNLVVSLPGKHLCGEDCKGICPECGKNLNNGSCDCSRDVTDPRFDILDSLNLD